ncbi:hypothetical protein ACGC1H_007295 [Rhizoctonia solani]
MQNEQDEPKGLNILCIDGGGVRGLSSLIILQEIMRRAAHANAGAKIEPHEYFDMIAGTGTGGISACMLGRLRMPIDKTVAEYARLVKEVFKDKKIGGPTMYKGTRLQEALKTMIRVATGNEEEKMEEEGQSNGCRTVVFAMARHNLNAGLPVMFRSYPMTTNPGPDCTIWEALYATMAHPDLFKPIDIIDSFVPQSFIGGELGCSNPLPHVLSEVKRIYPDRHLASIISIGAGHARTIQVPAPSRWHRTQDVIAMKDMARDSERVAEEMMGRFKGTGDVYFRFNVDQGMQNMKDGSWERIGEAMQHAKAYVQKGETSDKLDKAVHASILRRGAVATEHVAGEILCIIDSTKKLADFKRCPAPTTFYTGREKENTQLITCITEGKNELRVCVVYGLGGVGKTQLVLNVIERTWDEWDHIIYVDASSADSIENALTAFGTANKSGDGYTDVIRWLETCGKRWLVAFDNADTASTNLRQYIPARGRGSSVLITTRLPDLARLARGPNSVCRLSSMGQSDGTALLVKLVCSGNQPIMDDDETSTDKLVKDFEGLALAIVHAGAYIAHSPGMSIAKYRSLFLSQRQRMLEEYNKLPAAAKLDERGDTVYTTWRMCYDQLQPVSRELLWLIAYLHYDGIFEDMFKRAAQYMGSKHYPLPLTNPESQAQSHVMQSLSTFLDRDGKWDTVKFTQVMADLSAYSLIDFDRLNLSYRVHVLVHDWAKTVVPHTSKLAIECSATMLSLSIDWEKDTESMAFKRQLELHVTSMLAHDPNLAANHTYYFQEVYYLTGHWTRRAPLVQHLYYAFQQELGDDHEETWFVMNELSLNYSESGHLNKALLLQTQLLSARKRVLGEEHPHTLLSMNNLASTYSNLGRYTEAEQLHAQALNAHKQVLGEEHRDTLNSISNLASTYSHLGRYTEAEQLHAQALNTRKRVLGEDHPDTLLSMSNLALTFSDLGRYTKAEQLQIQVLDAHKRVLGEEHPDTLIPMNNLASTYSHLGRYNKAEQLQIQVLDACKRVLGEEHPNTLISMNNLATTCSNLGRYNEAEQLEVQVLNARKRVLGEEHPDTLFSRSNLATTYSYLGRYNEAEQLEVQVLNARKRVLGEEHPDTLFSRSNLALTYSHLGQYNEAQQLHVQVLDARKRVLGEEHPDTLQSMNDLASTYSHLGRFTEAEQLYVQVLESRKQVLGEEHPDILRSMNNLASTYSDLGRYTEAEQLHVRVLNARKRVLGEEHPDTLVSMNRLARTYSHQGRYTEAEQLHVQELNICKQVLGEEHPDTLVSMNDVARTYTYLSRYTDAEQLHVRVLNARKRLLGEEHPNTLVSMNGLALTHSHLGRWDEAEELYHNATSIAERTLGNQHPHTQKYRKDYEDMRARRPTELVSTWFLGVYITSSY